MFHQRTSKYRCPRGASWYFLPAAATVGEIVLADSWAAFAMQRKTMASNSSGVYVLARYWILCVRLLARRQHNLTFKTFNRHAGVCLPLLPSHDAERRVASRRNERPLFGQCVRFHTAFIPIASIRSATFCTCFSGTRWGDWPAPLSYLWHFIAVEFRYCAFPVKVEI